mgnify:FL=1
MIWLPSSRICYSKTDRIEDGAEAVYVENEISVQEVVFVMDRFGYCKLLDKSTYERNQETVDTEQFMCSAA